MTLDELEELVPRARLDDGLTLDLYHRVSGDGPWYWEITTDYTLAAAGEAPTAPAAWEQTTAALVEILARTTRPDPVPDQKILGADGFLNIGYDFGYGFSWTFFDAPREPASGIGYYDTLDEVLAAAAAVRP